METKRIPHIACLSIILMASVGCTAKVKTPDAKIEGNGYEIEFDGGHSGKHCPPGHAKKGWC